MKELLAPRIKTDTIQSGIIEALADHELEILTQLGDSLSAWPTDAIVLSARAQNMLTTVKNTFQPVWGFWDQSIRSILTQAGQVLLDAAGSYRLA